MNKIIILFFMCLFFSCNGNKVVVSDSIMIACEKNGEEIKISDFATKAYLLPLETTEASLFGEVDKLVVHDGKIYVLDQRYVVRILIFDGVTGKFLGQIGTVGGAPGEYKSIQDFSIDEERNVLYALCNRNKVMTYSLSGEFIREHAMKFYAHKLEYNGDRFYFFCNHSSKFNLRITNLKCEELESFFSNEYYGANLRTLTLPFYKKNGALFYRQFLDNHVYRVDDEVRSYYTIDLGGETLPVKRFDNLSEKEVADMMSKVSCHIRYFTENEDLILFIFFDKDQPQVSVYYKKTKKGYTCHYSDFKDDFYNIEGVLFSYQAGPNKMIAVLPTMMVLDQLNDAGKKILTNHNITEDSNPILYIIDTN